MVDSYILDESGVPQLEPDIAKWGQWMQTANRTIARTDIGSVFVSTVFLGNDHRFFGEGPPILYETMIFGAPQFGTFQERYCTACEAREGHARALELVRTSAIST